MPESNKSFSFDFKFGYFDEDKVFQGAIRHDWNVVADSGWLDEKDPVKQRETYCNILSTMAESLCKEITHMPDEQWEKLWSSIHKRGAELIGSK